MKAPAPLYLNPDDSQGIGHPEASKRAVRVIEHGLKRMTVDFDERSYSTVRGYIGRLRLSPARLCWLAMLLKHHATGAVASDKVVNAAGAAIYQAVAFHCYRAALSLLVETAPRSYQDVRDLLPVLVAWPGALPPHLQANVAAVMGAHVVDAMTGKPFKRRALVARGGGINARC